MDIDYVLSRGVSEILPSKEGLAKLLNSKKIKLYQGFDPTAKSLHIGNFIGIRKLSQFQKLGHKVIFLVGDGTGQAGDPSGKESAREKFFTKDELLENAQGWIEQAKNILDFKGENPVEIKYNSEWLNSLGLVEILNIAQNFSVQQMIERDMFQRRMAKGEPINLREFIYPLLQGYDSVAMEVDLEIGGNDQLFNMLAGRTLLKNMKGKDKFILTMKLLTDSAGKKMGKSEGNAINLDNPAEDIFGKVMAFPDEMLESSFELLTDIETTPDNPLEAKKALAFDIVKQIKGEEEAVKAQDHFTSTFQEHAPEYSQEVDLQESALATIATAAKVSNSEAKRLISQSAVSVNGTPINDQNFKFYTGDKLRIGKKIFVTIK